MSLTVTVRDEQTGDEETGHVDDGDYLLITASPCFVGTIQTYPKTGTHVLTVKGRGQTSPLRAGPAESSDPRPQLPLGGGPVEDSAGVREHTTRSRTAGA